MCTTVETRKSWKGAECKKDKISGGSGKQRALELRYVTSRVISNESEEYENHEAMKPIPQTSVLYGEVIACAVGQHRRIC